MEKQGWKIVAIVSIVLLICSLSFTGWLFYKGQQDYVRTQICAYDICGINLGEHDAYFYAPDDYCYCFLQGELDFVEDLNIYLKKSE